MPRDAPVTSATFSLSLIACLRTITSQFQALIIHIGYCKYLSNQEHITGVGQTDVRFTSPPCDARMLPYFLHHGRLLDEVSENNYGRPARGPGRVSGIGAAAARTMVPQRAVRSNARPILHGDQRSFRYGSAVAALDPPSKEHGNPMVKSGVTILHRGHKRSE